MLTTRTKKIVSAALLALAFMVSVHMAHAEDVSAPYNVNATTENAWGSLSGSGGERTMCQSFVAQFDTITKLRSTLGIPSVTWGAGRTFVVALTSGGCYGQAGATNLQTKTLIQAEWEAFIGGHPKALTWTLSSAQSVTVGNTYYLSLQDGSYCNNCYESFESSTSVYSGGTLYYGVFNNSAYNDQSKDSYFEIIHDDDDDLVYSVGPTATIYSPPDDTVIPSVTVAAGLEARAYSSVISASDTPSTTTFDWLLFKDQTLAAFKLDQPADLVYSASGFSADRAVFSGLTGDNGDYELRARACQGVACGSYDTSSFSVVDASGTGTGQFIAPQLAPFPTFDCGISALWDGVDCVMTYVRDIFTWFFFPPPAWAFDPTSMFEFWESRWPIYYLFGPMESWQAGFDDGATCPMPTFFGTTFNGQDVPEYDLCDTLEAVAPAVEGNDFGRTTLQWSIYLFGALCALGIVKSIIQPK